MNILLDTHALIWFAEGASELSPGAKAALEEPRNQSFFSIASIWELAIKLQLGKLRMRRPLLPDFRRDLERASIQPLAIDYEHVVRAGELPFHHRDPFDRLLIAQAASERMTVVSHDSIFDDYDVTRLW
jgi:PIN domain nuclease of toxin-antitoxin system